MTQHAPLAITKTEACRFLLAYHHLLPGYQDLLPEYPGNGKDGILSYIKKVGCIQFDPLNIVGHNPELVLQSRISDFTPVMLRELLYTDRVLLDGWDKNMSIYPVEDRCYFERLRKRARERFGNHDRPAVKIMPEVRRALEEQGPLSSLDLDFDQMVGWSWSPTQIARAALESMYSWGELVVHHRVNTRKVYDFAVNHLPKRILNKPDPHQTLEEFRDWNVARRIRSVGLLWNKAGGAWLGLHGMKSKERQDSFARLSNAGHIKEIHIKDIHIPFYIPCSEVPLMKGVLAHKPPRPHAAIIAPLDNLLWDRGLVEQVFHFEYRWEVYKPVHERQYGYYVLPILYKDRFIARFEPGHNKKNKTLVIKKWWWEKDIEQTKVMTKALNACFKGFMRYLGAHTLHVHAKNVTLLEC